MADRLNNYPRLTPHLNSNILQHQQLPQQSQQQSQGDPHSLQSIPNSDRSRMWSAAQQYRGQNGAEMGGSQGNTQMPDLMRSQNLARAPNQMGQQQQFGLPSSQMNTPGQHSGFHDQQGGQQSHAQMAANFGNVGIPNSTSAQLQGNLNTRTSMIPALGSTSITRQIELMGMAQNQQHQNPQIGPPSFPTRMPQQQQQQAGMNGQSGQNQGQSLFVSQSADMNRGSPPHPTQTSASVPLQQGIMQANAQGLPAGRRPMTLAELRDRANAMQTTIARLDTMIANLNNNQAAYDQPTYMAQLTRFSNEAKSRREMLPKIIQAINAMASQGQNNGNPNGSQGGNPGNMPTIGSSPITQHQQAGPNGGTQSAWLSQAGSAQSQGFPMRSAPQLPSRGPSQPQNPQIVSQAHAPNQIQQNNLAPPQRPGSTSRQIPTQMSPSLSNQLTGNQFPPLQTPNLAQFPLPPPLDKAKFQESYTAFCSSRSIIYDERLMSVDNRPVDLHALHYHVLSEGGSTKVTQRDLWPVIGARMGFVQFPGTDTEPAKSGPGVAQQLQHLHKEYLSQFDQIYVHSVLQKKGFFNPPPNSAGASQANNSMAGTATGNMPGANQANMMNAVMGYAHTSAADMRSRGLPDGLISFVEQHRPRLQLTMQQQQAFRGMVQKPNAAGMSGQTSEPERMIPNVSGFPNISPQQQQAVPSAGARPPPQPHGHPQVGMNIFGAGHGQPQLQNPTIHGVPSWPARPTPMQSQQSVQFITAVKQEFIAKNLPNMKQHQVPETQRMDYLKTLDQAYRYAQEIDPKLPMYFYVLRDPDMIRKLVAIIFTTREQRNLMMTNSNPPKYILPFNTLSTLIVQVQNANAQFNAAVSAYGSQQASSVPHSSNGQPPSNNSQQRLAVPQQAPQQIQSTPSIPAQSVPPSSGSRPVNLHQPPPPKKKPQQAQVSAVITTTAPSPTPPTSTPAAATPAATPAATSPKTPKSPKGKAPAKPKASASAKRKSSKVVAPTSEPAQPTAPSPAGSLKRPREDEEIMVDTPVPSNAPSPKKAKTESEWEGPPSDELIKKEEQIENIKTEEDASAFIEQMAELIKLATGNDQELLTSDISETLDMILKGCGQDHADVSGASASMAPLGFGDSLGLRDPPSPPIHADEFQDFLDFTSCAADDNDSKPTTPDLVSSSSTNPSPESAADPADAAHSTTAFSSDSGKSVNFKLEDTDEVDPFRLGPWKEIDGGQSVYYQSNTWNWDAPMVVQEQSWAVGS